MSLSLGSHRINSKVWTTLLLLSSVASENWITVVLISVLLLGVAVKGLGHRLGLKGAAQKILFHDLLSSQTSGNGEKLRMPH